MSKTIQHTSKFKKDFKLYNNNQKVLLRLNDVLTKLSNGEPLPESYKNHALRGKYKGLFDCHLFPNIILIYGISEDTISLSRIGSHNKLELTESIPSKISYIDITDVHYFGVKPKKPQSLSDYLKKKRIKSK